MAILDRLMERLLARLLEWASKDPSLLDRVLPVLRLIIHSEALTALVAKSQSPIDDVVLQILRILIPKDAQVPMSDEYSSPDS